MGNSNSFEYPAPFIDLFKFELFAIISRKIWILNLNFGISRLKFNPLMIICLLWLIPIPEALCNWLLSGWVGVWLEWISVQILARTVDSCTWRVCAGSLGVWCRCEVVVCSHGWGPSPDMDRASTKSAPEYPSRRRRAPSCVFPSAAANKKCYERFWEVLRGSEWLSLGCGFSEERGAGKKK